MNIDENIDFLLKAKSPKVSAAFTYSVLNKIYTESDEEKFDTFISYSLRPTISVSSKFTDKVLTAIHEKCGNLGILGYIYRLAATASISAAAAFVGFFALPEAPLGSETLVAQYNQINEISDEISTITTIVAQEEYISMLKAAMK